MRNAMIYPKSYLLTHVTRTYTRNLQQKNTVRISNQNYLKVTVYITKVSLTALCLLDCHWFVDPEKFYEDCMYDMCSCELQVIFLLN